MDIDSAIRTCSHCDTQGHLDVLSNVSEIKDYEDKGIYWECDRLYKVLRCPNCEGIILLKGQYHSGIDNCPEYVQEYPQDHSVDAGIPDEIAKELQVLSKLRKLDCNSHLVCCRRILEKICRNLGATKQNLHEMVKELENTGKFTDPIRLLTDSLRKLGNIGAHDTGKSVAEDDLCKVERSVFIVLDYFYVAPHLSSDLSTKYS